MMTEIVTFRIKDGMSREEVTALYERSVPGWKVNPHLLHKSFLYDADNGVGGGVYLWKSIDAAHEAHGAPFKARIQELFGSAPEFRYFETPVVINNHAEADAQPGK